MADPTPSAGFVNVNEFDILGEIATQLGIDSSQAAKIAQANVDKIAAIIAGALEKDPNAGKPAASSMSSSGRRPRRTHLTRDAVLGVHELNQGQRARYQLLVSQGYSNAEAALRARARA